METLLAQLWNDDNGAIISTEYVLLASLLVAGIVPGMIHVRNQTNDTMSRLVPRLPEPAVAVPSAPLIQHEPILSTRTARYIPVIPSP